MSIITALSPDLLLDMTLVVLFHQMRVSASFRIRLATS